ncbi:type VII secretion-associated protein [Amycolatopsis sp. NPDC024027]|uniref:type VII secretion-associated protein n=1 Tax=Amycolatopsis sp. NPDC024027 TaxID=3154327 RepID=UPI0033E2DB7A
MIFTFTTEEPNRPFGRLAYKVAVQLARWRYRVLYVDWNTSDKAGGVADLIADRLDPLDAVRTLSLRGSDSVDVIVGGTADRLPANREDWAHAYTDGVADFLEECAERWQAVYDVVVIKGGRPGDPSRAIAVAHLPDAVVLDCRGTTAAAMHAASASRDLLPYGRAQLLVLPLHGNAEDYERWTLPWVHATVRPERVADLAAGDIRVIAALLANGLAGTDLLVADPAAYVFATKHHDGVTEAARAVRPELAQLAPERADLDRILRELLTAHPTPVARLRDVLVSDAHLDTWLAELLADLKLRPPDARTSLSADAPVRHQCPIDGNYVWYRHRSEPVPECPDHQVTLEAAPLAGRVAKGSLIADGASESIATSGPGPRPASGPGHEAPGPIDAAPLVRDLPWKTGNRRRLWGVAGVAVVVVAALVVAGIFVFRDSGTQAEPGWTLSQYDFKFVAPEDWVQTDDRVAQRQVVIHPQESRDGNDLLVAQEYVMDYDATADPQKLADELRKGAENDTQQQYSAYNPSASYAGRTVIFYHQVKPDRPDIQVDWYVVAKGRIRVHVGCQYATAPLRDRVAAACAQAVRTVDILN